MDGLKVAGLRTGKLSEPNLTWSMDGIIPGIKGSKPRRKNSNNKNHEQPRATTKTTTTTTTQKKA
jgi:hypothetical protein